MSVTLTKSNYVLTQKPATYEEVATVKNSIRNIVEASIDDLTKIVLENAYNSSIANGISEKNWKGQQVFSLDFDSGINPDSIIDKLESKNIIPNIVYTSMRDSNELRKFRVLIILDEIVTDYEIAKTIQLGLMKLCMGCDGKCKDLCRMYFPGKSIISSSYRLNSFDTLNSELDLKGAVSKQLYNNILMPTNCTFEDGKVNDDIFNIPDAFKEEVEYNSKPVFNNIMEYFKDNNDDFKIFDEKTKLCIPWFKSNIPEGKRNSTMLAYLSQIALLNEKAGFNFLKKIADSVNNCFIVKYDDEKVKGIVNYILNQRVKGKLMLNLNKERLIIFNPKSDLTRTEKRVVVAKVVGKNKSDKTKQDINDLLVEWDFELNGEINQEKVSKILGKSLRTIKTYWGEFKDYIKELNNDNKAK